MSRSYWTVAAVALEVQKRELYEEWALCVPIIYFMTSSGQKKKKQAHRMALNLKSIISHTKKKEIQLRVDSHPSLAIFILGNSIINNYFYLGT